MNVKRVAVCAVLALAGMAALGRAAGAEPQAAAPQKPITWPVVNSQIGTSYPIDELENTLMFSLESVAVASRFAAAEKNVVAGPGKRLLILTGSLLNVQTHEYPLASNLVAVNAFSETGERSVSTSESFVLPGLTSFPVNLKPKETLRFVAIVQIHEAGPVKRVVVFRGSRATRRAWYDIQSNLGAMQSAFADGTDLRERAQAKVGQVFDLGAFDMAVQSAGPVSSAGTYQSSSSTQVYAVALKVTNAMRAPANFGWQYATPTLVDAEGKELNWSRDLIDSASGKSAGAEMQPGRSYLLQYVFSAERGRALKEFTLVVTGGRTVVVDVR